MIGWTLTIEKPWPRHDSVNFMYNVDSQSDTETKKKNIWTWCVLI